MKTLLSSTILFSATYISFLIPKEQNFVQLDRCSMSSGSFETYTAASQDDKTAYVTAKSGLVQRLSPNGTPIGKFPYGSQLEIVEHTGLKFEVIDNGENINGEWVGVKFAPYHGSQPDVVYVFDGYLGDESELELLPGLLPMVTSYNTSDYSYRDKKEVEILIDSIFSFEIIDKNQFSKLKESTKEFIVRDTSNIKHEKDTLWIFTDHKIVKLVDRPDAEESKVLHDFMGQVPFLNASLIKKDFWEGRKYIFLDNKTGELLQVLNLDDTYSEYNGQYPNISPDKRYILSISGSPYEGQMTEMQLYKIESKSKISQVLSASFINWNESETYWISNKELIIKCEPVFLDKYGYKSSISGNYRYFKLTIK